METTEHIFQASIWNVLCQQVISHAADLGRASSSPMRDLMFAVADRFSSQDPPLTLVELDRRTIQSASACFVIGSVSHANGMARFLPESMAEVYEASHSFSHRDLPTSEDEFQALAQETLAFHAAIGAICHGHVME
jgi:hypothetical protein